MKRDYIFRGAPYAPISLVLTILYSAKDTCKRVLASEILIGVSA